MQHKIVYLSHGGQKHYVQTRFSVLSLLHLLMKQQRNDVRVVIYTDKPEEVPAHDFIDTHSISSEDLARFRGPLDFVHRIKLEVLRRAEASIGVPFLYVDCDTKWISLPTEQLQLLADSKHVSPSVFYFYEFEGVISSSFFPQYFGLLQKKKKRLAQWNISPNPPWPMWNSGAIGVPAGVVGFFDDILTITDDLILDVRLRNWVEQLALSLFATSRFEVRPLDDCIAHYWAYGTEMPILLGRFFCNLREGLTTEELAEQCARFSINEYELRQIQQMPSNQFRRWCAKQKNSLQKRKVDIRAFWMRTRQG